jgi:hypothetical protein
MLAFLTCEYKITKIRRFIMATSEELELERDNKFKFGESLPTKERFQAKVDMAANARALAKQTREQLTLEIRQANEELEAAGKIGEQVKFRVPELFRLRHGANTRITYQGTPAHRVPVMREVDGTFEGLTVLDTTEVDYAGRYLEERLGTGLDPVIVCAAFTDTDSPEMASYVPLYWLEGPQQASMRLMGIGQSAVQSAGPEIN